MVLRKDAGFLAIALTVWTLLAPAAALGAGLEGMRGVKGASGLWGFYDTFTDGLCQNHYVTVWSRAEVERLAGDGMIHSYREFFDCHQICR